MRRWLLALVMLLLLSGGLAVRHLATGADGASGGRRSVDATWDPTGSHPLPNESVHEGPGQGQ